MARFIQVNDIHLSDRPPRYRTNTYRQDIMDKLAWVFRKAIDTHSDFVLMTGDVFHHPQPSRVSHSLVNDLMALFSEYPLPVLVVPGNHDLMGGRLDSLDRQPLGTLTSHPNVKLLHEEYEYEVAGLIVKGVAWNYAINAEYIFSRVPDKVHVLGLHAPILSGSNPFFEAIQPSALDNLADVVCHGHIHSPSWHTTENTAFSNPGSLSRRCLGGGLEDESDRVPSVAVIDLEPGGSPAVEYLAVEHRPSEEVYRLELHDVHKRDNEALDIFIRSLSDATLTAHTPKSLAEEAVKLTEESEVQRYLQTLFEQVG